MATISISSRGGGVFDVTITEPGSTTRHEIHASRRARLSAIAVPDVEALVRHSVEFLLEREAATSILPRFSLDDIARYFPDYPEVIARRIGS